MRAAQRRHHRLLGRRLLRADRRARRDVPRRQRRGSLCVRAAQRRHRRLLGRRPLRADRRARRDVPRRQRRERACVRAAQRRHRRLLGLQHARTGRRARWRVHRGQRRVRLFVRAAQRRDRRLLGQQRLWPNGRARRDVPRRQRRRLPRLRAAQRRHRRLLGTAPRTRRGPARGIVHRRRRRGTRVVRLAPRQDRGMLAEPAPRGAPRGHRLPAERTEAALTPRSAHLPEPDAPLASRELLEPLKVLRRDRCRRAGRVRVRGSLCGRFARLRIAQRSHRADPGAGPVGPGGFSARLAWCWWRWRAPIQTRLIRPSVIHLRPLSPKRRGRWRWFPWQSRSWLSCLRFRRCRRVSGCRGPPPKPWRIWLGESPWVLWRLSLEARIGRWQDSGRQVGGLLVVAAGWGRPGRCGWCGRCAPSWAPAGARCGGWRTSWASAWGRCASGSVRPASAAARRRAP